MAASGVDFFDGIAAAGEADLLGAGVDSDLAAGDEDLVGEGEAVDLGAGGAVFSVVTETLGSEDFSAVVASGEAAGEGLSSWARESEVAAAKRAVMATSVIFIWFSG